MIISNNENSIEYASYNIDILKQDWYTKFWNKYNNSMSEQMKESITFKRGKNNL